jgi:hypothetical protein
MSAQVLRWPTLPEQGELLPTETFGRGLPERCGAPVLTMDTNDTTTVVVRAIRDHFDGKKDAAKLLARKANSNVRAARNWLDGANLPDVVHFLRLMAQVPELAAEVRRLTGLKSDLDPEFDAAIHATMQAYSRIKARERGAA